MAATPPAAKRPRRSHRSEAKESDHPVKAFIEAEKRLNLAYEDGIGENMDLKLIGGFNFEIDLKEDDNFYGSGLRLAEGVVEFYDKYDRLSISMGWIPNEKKNENQFVISVSSGENENKAVFAWNTATNRIVEGCEDSWAVIINRNADNFDRIKNAITAARRAIIAGVDNKPYWPQTALVSATYKAVKEIEFIPRIVKCEYTIVCGETPMKVESGGGESAESDAESDGTF